MSSVTYVALSTAFTFRAIFRVDYALHFFMFDYSTIFFLSWPITVVMLTTFIPQLLFSVISSPSIRDVGYRGLFVLLLLQLQVLLKIFLLELVRLLLTVVGACYPHLSLDICSSSWNLTEEKEELYERFLPDETF